MKCVNLNYEYFMNSKTNNQYASAYANESEISTNNLSN